MDNLKISLLLHFYQPWWQFPAVLKRVVAQCYKPMLEIVNGSDGFCFTANINLSLLELLLENGYADVISGFRYAVEKGRLELLGSPVQHPIVPLIPEFLQRAQLEEDERQKQERFGMKRNCGGVFLPEMAFSRKDVDTLKGLGYRWTVIDDEPFRCVHGYVPFDHITAWGGLKLYMRSRRWSYGGNGLEGVASGKLSFPDLKARMECEIPGWTRNNPAYIIMAMDAETFGHHHGHLLESMLKPMLKEWAGNRLISIENLGNSFPSRSINYVPDGSWSTHEDNIRQNDPYHLWNSRFNIYHSKLWQLVNMALDHFQDCRDDCLKMTSSCHWWWIAGYPHPYWNPEFMKLGAKKAVEVIRRHGTPGEKEVAEKIYDELKKLH